MNENTRTLKRLIIIVVYIAIVALLVFLYYFFSSSKENCSDGIKNQNEEAVDCGGSCAPCQKIEVEPLQALEAGVTESGQEGLVDIFAKIENPNVQIGAKEVQYDFVALDDQGEELGSFSNITFLLPQETKFIFQANVKLEKNKINRIVWKAKSAEWVKFSTTFQNPQLKIVNKKLEVNSSESLASGLLRNESPYDLTLIKIKVILRDEKNKIRYINFTDMRTVKSQEERGFKVFWPGRLPDNIVKVEVETEVNVFDPHSFFREYYETQKFQEFVSN